MAIARNTIMPAPATKLPAQQRKVDSISPTDSWQERAGLLQRIRRQYDIVTDELRFGSLTISFTRVRNPDRVLDQVVREEDRRERESGTRLQGDCLHLPYWAQLWDSAAGLAHHLHADAADASGSVLDLGCGMGLSGTVAAASGRRVLFADLESPPLLFARLNSFPWKHRVRTRRINWQVGQLDEKFDVILGADILYEKDQWEHLNRFWRAHLSAGGEVLLGEPGRQTGDLFLDWIRQHDWNLSQTEQPVATNPRPVRIFRLSLPQ